MYWGQLYSIKGRALDYLGQVRLTVNFGRQTVDWDFIVAEIGDHEEILGNNFAMAHKITVQIRNAETRAGTTETKG